MTKFDDERRAADVRYTLAKRAAEKITADTPKAEMQAIVDELIKAGAEARRLARQAGSESLKEKAQ